jgi:hypothetical protein
MSSTSDVRLPKIDVEVDVKISVSDYSTRVVQSAKQVVATCHPFELLPASLTSDVRSRVQEQALAATDALSRHVEKLARDLVPARAVEEGEEKPAETRRFQVSVETRLSDKVKVDHSTEHVTFASLTISVEHQVPKDFKLDACAAIGDAIDALVTNACSILQGTYGTPDDRLCSTCKRDLYGTGQRGVCDDCRDRERRRREASAEV